MSHYDVVPAPDNTLSQWTHPPFSGHNDGTSIWGRGAQDDKTLLVGQWEAVTHLLEGGWSPRRTLILSHGFDEEEVFARRGQGHIAPVLEKRYPKGVLMVVDEGGGNDEVGRVWDGMIVGLKRSSTAPSLRFRAWGKRVTSTSKSRSSRPEGTRPSRQSTRGSASCLRSSPQSRQTRSSRL
jgi:acetylornithine deacetylase/succinyl-diaminopimelate desuccinylase-like protein